MACEQFEWNHSESSHRLSGETECKLIAEELRKRFRQEKQQGAVMEAEIS